MQTQKIYVKMNGVQGQVVDASNSANGRIAPSFSRGQKFQLQIGLFDGDGDTILDKTAVDAIAASWNACADSEFGQETPAITADSVTVDTDGYLVATFTGTNTSRLQNILTNKNKETLKCEICGFAQNETQPCFVVVFEILVFQRIGMSGIEAAE